MRDESRHSWKVGEKTYDPLVIIKDILDRCKPEKGSKDKVILSVTYTHSKKADCHGRQFAREGRSLQSVAREIRHTVSGEYYHDIDMVNAHPTLLLQYCDKKGYAIERIRHYIDNRDACLNDLMINNNITRDHAKRVVLSITNAGLEDYSALMHKPTWLTQYLNQCQLIHKHMVDDVNNKALVAEVKRGGSKNVFGSVCNHILCNIENSLIESCKLFLIARQIQTTNLVLMFDGFMIPRGVVKIDDQFCADLNKYVKDAQGYDVAFVEKAMDCVIDLTGLFLSNVPSSVIESRVAVNDNEAANIFMEDVRFMLRKSNGKIFIRNEINMWVCDKSVIKSILLEKCLTANIVDANLRSYSSNVMKAKNIIAATLSKLTNDPLFISKMWKSTLGKLCFEDGVYDFASRSFTKWENVTDVYTTIIINRPFPKRNDEMVGQVYERVFKSAFGEDEKIADVLKLIARGLAGCVEDKQFGVGMGERNSSKGIVVELCQAAFEGYVNTIKTEYFLMERTGNSDPAKKEGWMMDCEFTRLTFSNEVTVDVSDKRHKIDGNVIKRFASGGDELISRRLHENSRPFRVQSRMFIMCNDLPPVTPAGAMETMVLINFPYKFVSKEDMIKPLPFFRARDETLKHWIKEPEVSNAFIHLILDAYEDTAMVMNKIVRKETLDCREDTGDELMLFRTLFEITKNDNDFIPVSEVHEMLQSRGVNMSAIAIKRRLTSMGSINKPVKPEGTTKTVRSYIRISLRADEEE